MSRRDAGIGDLYEVCLRRVWCLRGGCAVRRSGDGAGAVRASAGANESLRVGSEGNDAELNTKRLGLLLCRDAEKSGLYPGCLLRLSLASCPAVRGEMAGPLRIQSIRSEGAGGAALWAAVPTDFSDCLRSSSACEEDVWGAVRGGRTGYAGGVANARVLTECDTGRSGPLTLSVTLRSGVRRPVRVRSASSACILATTNRLQNRKKGRFVNENSKSKTSIV